jgi:hypothetical protein
MSTLIIIEFFLLLLVSVIAYIFYSKYKKEKIENKDLLFKYKSLSEEFHKVLEVNKIKDKNKEEADEKINNLHNGNVVDNAINILRK